MKKIDRYIIKSYIGPFLMTFFIAVFILLMQFLWKYIDDLVGKGLEWHIILQLMFYASFTFIPLALPLAILMSSLMLFGNLGEKYELVAMKSAGISLSKMMRPLIYLTVIISISAFIFSNYLLPVANLKMQSLLYDVREQKPALSIDEGVFYTGIDNYVIRVAKKERDNQTVRDVLIYDHSKGMGNTAVTRAEWGTMLMTDDKSKLIFTLYNGFAYDEDMKRGLFEMNRPITRVKFREQRKIFDLSSFSMERTNEEFFKDNYQMLNVKQLNYFIDSLYSDHNEKQVSATVRLSESFYYFTHAYDSTLKKLPQDYTEFSDNIYSGFSYNEKTMIYDNAIQAARSQKDINEFRHVDVEYQKKSIIRYEVEWHRKFTLSVACIILFFIGAPLGAIIRKGGMGIPMVATVLIFVIFWVLSITGEKFAREAVLEPYAGMWIASVVLLPLGIYLTRKSTADSPLLDAESWGKFFSKINILDYLKPLFKKDEDTTNMQ
ncbi:MAG: LptF/LptG family permease [Bacteroidales bacterium]